MARIGVALPVDDGYAMPELVEMARAAEALGYGAVFCGEVRSTEAFALLGLVAASTSKVHLGTAVIGIGVRSVALTAMGFATLAAVAPGRVTAGVGVSSRDIVQGWHGREFFPPLAQVESFVPALRAALAGTSIDVDAAGVTSSGFRLTRAAVPQVPILVAALNPRMLELAARVADGVIIAWTSPDALAHDVKHFRSAAAAFGRDPDTLKVIATLFAYAGPDVEHARSNVRDRILRYCQSEGHRRRFALYVDDIDEAATAWRSGDRGRARELIPDAAVDAFAAIGDGQTVAKQIEEFLVAGVDLPLIYPVGKNDEGGTLREIANAVGES
jgi:probable F420-dependent oxidoreductase